MANYKTHVSFGAGAGAVVSFAALVWVPGVQWDTVLFGIFFGFLGGMVPDLDHDQGRALGTITELLSTLLPVLVLVAFVPRKGNIATMSLLLILPCHYLLHWALGQIPPWTRRAPFSDSIKAIVVGGICSFPAALFFSPLPWGFSNTVLLMLAINIVVQISIPFFKHITVHRGVFHSIPTVVIYACIVYLLFAKDAKIYPLHRFLLALAAFAGALSHLILDEIYSVDFDGKKIRVKRSFGTAFSFWVKEYPHTSLFAYILAAALLLASLYTTFL